MSRDSKRARERGEESQGGHAARVPAAAGGEAAPEVATLIRRHQRFGWWTLLFFILMGLFLETLHGLKAGWYLEAANTTRRHLWTLAHAHGTLLAVLNLILAHSFRSTAVWSARRLHLASACLRSAAVLLPSGFFLGGWFTYGGDPGIGIVLVPIGGVLLVVAVVLAATG